VVDLSSPKRAGKQPAETAEQTKRAMIEAALRVFAQHGFDGVSLRDIAAEAGTTHGLIRHHFGTKEGIWHAAVDHAIERYASALAPYAERAHDQQADPILLAKEIVGRFVLVSAAYPEIVRLILHEGMRGGARLDYALGCFAPLGQQMAPLLAQVQQRGFLQHFDNRTFFIFLLTTGAAPFALSALVRWVIEDDIGGERQAQEHADRVVATLFGHRGLP